MRSGPVLRPRSLRSLLAVTALVVAGLFVLAPSASAEGAGPEGPAASVSAPRTPGDGTGVLAQVSSKDTPTATLLGLVFRDAAGNLATKVRAIGLNGVVCGTGNVLVVDSGRGLYRMDVVGGTTRTGCPAEGGALTFRLLYGSVDGGSAAISSQAVRFVSGETLVASLTPVPASARSNWLGETPASGEDALLTWVGADGTPIEDALGLLDVSVVRASHYDADSRRLLSFTPGGPSFLQSYRTVGYGDVVRVRVE